MLLLGLSTSAVALPVGRQFAMAGGTVAWSAALGDGTTQSSPITVDSAEVALGGELPDADQLTAGQHYFYVALHANREFAGILAPIATPQTGATLTTATGAVTGQAPPANLGDDAQWYFPVPADLRSATLQVDGFTKVLGNERGDFIPWTFGPLTVDFVATSPVPASPSTSVPTVPTQTHTASRSQKTVTAATGGGTSLVATLGAGLAGLAVVAGGAAGLVSLIRRRRFYRADREGRIVLSGPPALVAGTALPIGAAAPRDRRAILVKLLGALEIEGTKRQVTAGPLLEIIVFLALHPGQSFTSVQLRQQIWGLGRQPITAASFRTYMSAFRKAFGSGVVVTDVYRYRLTEAVTSDWELFQAALQAVDELTGREQALALVRGPVLHGSFDSRKNAPFSWAVDTVNRIEDEVTNVAVELAVSCLEQDPRRAADAVSQGLLCSNANLRLRMVDLRVGAALGGTREVGRRLEAGRSAMAIFPKDVAELEGVARQLGWSAPVSG
jgi:hypothetical protein